MDKKTDKLPNFPNTQGALSAGDTGRARTQT